MQEMNKAKISMSLGGKQKREMSPRASSLGASEKRQLEEMPRGLPVRGFRKAALLQSMAALGKSGPTFSVTVQLCSLFVEGGGCTVSPPPAKRTEGQNEWPGKGPATQLGLHCWQMWEGWPLTRGSWKAPGSYRAGSRSERQKRRASSCGRVDLGSLSSPSSRTWGSRGSRGASALSPLESPPDSAHYIFLPFFMHNSVSHSQIPPGSHRFSPPPGIFRKTFSRMLGAPDMRWKQQEI